MIGITDQLREKVQELKVKAAGGDFVENEWQMAILDAEEQGRMSTVAQLTAEMRHYRGLFLSKN